MLVLLLKQPIDVAACFTAASAAVADRLSVQVFMLWLVRQLVALACNSSRLHAAPGPSHGQYMHQYNASTKCNRRLRPTQLNIQMFFSFNLFLYVKCSSYLIIQLYYFDCFIVY